jgi:ATP phosphoribosyltransferase
MSAVLTLAVPSKGRLQEQAQAYFADAGLALQQAAGARGYRATVAGFPDIDVRLLSASEIAAALIAGDVHLGITGEDLLRESVSELDKSIALVKPLGFGFADVVVAVPQAWIDVAGMADLDDVCAAFFQRHRRRLRIATKYVNLTRAFFAKAGIWDYRIVESAGATEGAPAAGTAELIVDITTTGTTLAANALKVIDDGLILRSQANLVAARTARWGASERETARLVLDRIAAQARARAFREVRTRFARCDEALLGLAKTRFGVETPFGGPTSSGMLTLHCPPAHVHGLASLLREHGAENVAVADLGYVFARENALFAKLAAGLG